MAADSASAFVVVEHYLSALLGVDVACLTPGKTEVVESPLRLRPLASYSFAHAFWWVRLEDGRSVASVVPGAGEWVAAALRDAGNTTMADPTTVSRLRAVVDAPLPDPRCRFTLRSEPRWMRAPTILAGCCGRPQWMTTGDCAN